MVAGLSAFAGSAAANPIYMPTLDKALAHARVEQHAGQGTPQRAVQPPAVPCPEANQLPAPAGECGPPQPPATTLPFPGNMAYWGGHVQVHPKEYLVFMDWGVKGAFSSRCHPVTLSEGTTRATLRCDPDGAGKRMADFVSQMGGTQWAGVSTQYYQTVNDPAGQPFNEYIANDRNVLAGIWVDDSFAVPTNKDKRAAFPTYTDMAKEAERAMRHFHVSDLNNASFIIAQPQNISDPQATANGYCAFHDYTLPGFFGGIYNGITPGISYTNEPYQLDINIGGSNVCGENAVNSGPTGVLDGYTITLGHEIEETITDPAAEDILGSGTSTQPLGGWYDAADPNENGDKCAWVGEPLITGLPGEPNVIPEPGALNNITGNRGESFAVQSLWSNNAAEGAGYCAGAGNDLPQPVPPV